jgi:aromatic-amino-acid transaminase
VSFLIPARRARPTDDPIFALSAEAQARARAGEPIVNATVGALLDEEGRLAVLPTVAETMREVSPEESAAYAPIAGPPAFLRAVVDDIFGAAPAAAWATAVATPGGTGALRHAIVNFLEPAQSLLTTSFYWGPYRTLADEADRGIEVFRMFDERGRLDVEDLDRKLDAQMTCQGRALVFLNSPCHNPTGYSLDASEIGDVVTAVRRAGARGSVTLLVDMAYARYGAADLTEALQQVLGLAGEALLLFAWSASKAFTEYGARVGALVAVHPDPNERAAVQSALTYSCRGTWSNCNAGGMAAIARILTTPDLRARVDRERADLKALLGCRVARWNALAPEAGLRYPRYDGGFFTTVFCNDAAAVGAKLKADGVFVVPQAGALRVALCSVAERDVPRLVEALARHIG